MTEELADLCQHGCHVYPIPSHLISSRPIPLFTRHGIASVLFTCLISLSLSRVLFPPFCHVHCSIKKKASNSFTSVCSLLYSVGLITTNYSLQHHRIQPHVVLMHISKGYDWGEGGRQGGTEQSIQGNQASSMIRMSYTFFILFLSTQTDGSSPVDQQRT